MKAKFFKLRKKNVQYYINKFMGRTLLYFFCFLIMLPLTIIFMPIDTLRHPVWLFKDIVGRFRQALNETF